jgi:hypothetical protein
MAWRFESSLRQGFKESLEIFVVECKSKKKYVDRASFYTL